MNQMKIATWNIERLKQSKKIAQIITACENVNADILILTEYDERVDLKNYPFQISTRGLADLDAKYYEHTEKRVKIYSKYEITKQYETYDEFTSCCAEINTEFGKLNVYGTILGILGNRCQNFKTDLPKQIVDYKKFSINQNLCVAGDFNISFSDNYYFTHSGRNELNECFKETGMTNLTENLVWNIDHIAITKEFLKLAEIELFEWNLEKNLSDHKGISAKLKVEVLADS